MDGDGYDNYNDYDVGNSILFHAERLEVECTAETYICMVAEIDIWVG